MVSIAGDGSARADGTAEWADRFTPHEPGPLARIFPHRELLIRTNGRVRFVTLSMRGQVTIAAAALAILGWVGYAIFTQTQFDESIAAKDREIAAVSVTLANFQSRFKASESQFRSVARTLEAKHAYLLALLDRQMSSGDIPIAHHAGGGLQEDKTRRRLESSRRALLAQLGSIEGVLGGKARDSVDVKDTALNPEGVPPLAGLERARLEREQKRLISRIDKLEQRLLAINGSQRGVMDFLAAQSVDDFERAKKLVAISGLDVDDLLSRLGRTESNGQGGPFIAAVPELGTPVSVPVALGVIDNQLDRWEALGVLISRLPLIAPVDHYYVASRFGKRRDPFNRRWAMHYGVDLGGVYRSPIRATAPGIVVKVGWNGNYGRIVEIDHGLGIRTRYGHLHRTSVKPGQKVGFRHKIGQMGSSGRSTGTHVHYEILVNGEPMDPAKFMEAGDHVLEGY